MKQGPKIVVVTPVKNEAWILDRFLAVTSQFADHIIVADQASTDSSLTICENYSKVTLINNHSSSFNEAERQQLLIRTARDIVPGPRILLALDADEVLAANAATSPSWNAMLNAEPGTVLCIEKPDLYGSTKQCIRHEKPWPIGYVDDGAEHNPKTIHSIRIPQPNNAKVLNLTDVKVMHYALTCFARQQSKMRLYSVLENRLGTTPSLLRRRLTYHSKKDYSIFGNLEPSPTEWFVAWEASGIDMHSTASATHFWQDFEVLRHFKEYGERRFWSDDIWDTDWEAHRLYALSHSIDGMPSKPVLYPPTIMNTMLRFGDAVFSSALKAKRLLLR